MSFSHKTVNRQAMKEQCFFTWVSKRITFANTYLTGATFTTRSASVTSASESTDLPASRSLVLAFSFSSSLSARAGECFHLLPFPHVVSFPRPCTCNGHSHSSLILPYACSNSLGRFIRRTPKHLTHAPFDDTCVTQHSLLVRHKYTSEATGTSHPARTYNCAITRDNRFSLFTLCVSLILKKPATCYLFSLLQSTLLHPLSLDYMSANFTAHGKTREGKKKMSSAPEKHIRCHLRIRVSAKVKRSLCCLVCRWRHVLVETLWTLMKEVCFCRTCVAEWPQFAVAWFAGDASGKVEETGRRRRRRENGKYSWCLGGLNDGEYRLPLWVTWDGKQDSNEKEQEREESFIGGLRWNTWNTHQSDQEMLKSSFVLLFNYQG